VARVRGVGDEAAVPDKLHRLADGPWLRVDRVDVEVAGHAPRVCGTVTCRDKRSRQPPSATRTGPHYVGAVRALVKTQAGPGLELKEVPEPQSGPTDVTIRILRAGLCGTDLHLEQWDDWAASTVHPPLTIGHEFYGEVVEVGEDVDSVSVGQRSSGEGHIVCGTCRNCRAGRRHMCINTKGVGVNRAGAFADYVVIPASNVWVQPDDLDPDLAAVFDPLGNATHTALSFPMAGEDVVITGAGPIGVMAAALARHVGARHVVVTDLSDYRL